MPKASTRTSAGAYFSRWLKAFRVQYNYTVQELADACGMQPRSLHSYEANDFDPTLQHLIKLSVFSGVTVPEMVGVNITGLPPKIGGVRYNYRTGDWTAKWVETGRGVNKHLGHFATEQQAVAAIIKQRNIHKGSGRGNSELQGNVHPGRGEDDVRLGPRFSGPSDSNVGVGLSRDEGPV